MTNIRRSAEHADQSNMSWKFAKFLCIISQIFSVFCTDSCLKDLKLMWSASVSDSPIVSSPLLAKTHKISHKDLIATTLDGTVNVVDSTSGKERQEWPMFFPEESFYSGPLLYDIDEDGSLDILLAAEYGKILFISQNGTSLQEYNIHLPRLLVRKKWYSIGAGDAATTNTDFSPEKNSFFHSSNDKFTSDDIDVKSFIGLDLHILSTPIISDFNGNGFNNDLIIPVNYYIDDEVKYNKKYLKILNLNQSDIDCCLANGVIVVDLRTRNVIFKKIFELTRKSSAFPAYILSSPFVMDLDGNQSNCEVIVGSMTGKLHIWNKYGNYPRFSDLADSITSDVAIGDMDNDGYMEIIVVDGSANVMCYSYDKLLWDATVSGTGTVGPQLYDIDNNGQLEVVIASSDGYLWVLNGQTGEVLPKWPIKLCDKFYSNILFTSEINNKVYLMLTGGENLHILGADINCMNVVPIDEVSYTQVIYDRENLAYFLSTADGVILSFVQFNATNKKLGEDRQIAFTEVTRQQQAIQTSNFVVEFEIFPSNENNDTYMVLISYACEIGKRIHTVKYKSVGLYSVTLPSPKIPISTYITVELCNRFMQCTKDIAFLNFHSNAKKMLIIYGLLPFLVMVTLLLVIHGFPEGDLLPTWQRSNKNFKN